jgi:putative SOS response-associated peptidase YedK
MAETVRSKPMFREAYRKRRCIVPVEGFFEWQATKGGKQPYAIAMKNGAPFGLAGLWENWKDPASGDWVRTFTIITVPSNELIARIHNACRRSCDLPTMRGGLAASRTRMTC